MISLWSFAKRPIANVLYCTYSNTSEHSPAEEVIEAITRTRAASALSLQLPQQVTSCGRARILCNPTLFVCTWQNQVQHLYVSTQHTITLGTDIQFGFGDAHGSVLASRFKTNMRILSYRRFNLGFLISRWKEEVEEKNILRHTHTHAHRENHFKYLILTFCVILVVTSVQWVCFNYNT